MDKTDMPVFLASLLKLAKAYGEPLDKERMSIYFEDLMEFPMEQVLSAMTWARRNLSHFPKIAELRGHIEGDPEDRSNRAWKAILRLLQVSPTATVLVTDPVMGRTMQSLWVDLRGMSDAFGRLESETGHAALRKTFKTAYLELWKHRHESQGPVTFSVPAPDPASLVIPAEIDDVVVQDYEVRLQGRRTIRPEWGERVPMPEHMRQRLDHLLRDLGKGGTPEALAPKRPGRSPLPAPWGWSPDVTPLRLLPDGGEPADGPGGESVGGE